MITIGSVTGDQAWTNAANGLLAKHNFLGIHTQWYVFLFGTLLNILFALLLIFGGRVYWRVQKWLFLVAGLGILAMVALLLVRGTSIASSWDAFAAKNGTLKYGQVIPAAQAAGFTGAPRRSASPPPCSCCRGCSSSWATPRARRRSAARSSGPPAPVLRHGRRRPDQRAVLAIIVLLTTARGRHQLGCAAWTTWPTTIPAKLGLPGGLPAGINFVVSAAHPQRRRCSLCSASAS